MLSGKQQVGLKKVKSGRILRWMPQRTLQGRYSDISSRRNIAYKRLSIQDEDEGFAKY